jgi:hypothetical protein
MSVFESALKDQTVRSAAEGDWPEQDTERIILAAARVGQHVFALNVLNNCGHRCVFCGLSLRHRNADRGRPSVEFSWQGSDEGDDASGRDWAALNPDGMLEGHIYFHLGDDSAFRAQRFNAVIQ